MIKRILTLVIFSILLIKSAHAQVEFSPDHNNQPQKFTGFHGHFITSGEFIRVNPVVFKTLLTSEELPVLDIAPGFYLSSMSFLRKRLYTNIGYSYAPDDEITNDRLKSKLTQTSFVGRVGYNLFRNNIMVVSPYAGIRYTRFRHLTGLKHIKVTLDDYLETRMIDLRLSQYSAETGVNVNFLIRSYWSVGIYAAWLHSLQNNAFVRTGQNRIYDFNPGTPVRNFMVGIGFGFGGHNFN
jgi:hypothetical protein